jgi:histidyl-tRNA synthetase
MYAIRLNSRKLVDYILHGYLGLNDTQAHTIVKLIDRMHKMPAETFAVEIEAIFTPTQREEGASNKLLGLLKTKQIQHLPEVIRNHHAITELQALMDALKDSRITNAVFDITLMRGFDYYTDIVFEVFDNHPDNNRSMFGGGRYDGLVGLFGVEPVPTVGFGMGDVGLQNFLETHELLPQLRPETDVYVIFMGDGALKAQKVIAELRSLGVNVAVDSTGRKTDKQIKAAVKKGIHYALFIGEKELTEERYVLRNLKTSAEETHGVSRLVSIVKDYRDDDL